MRDNQFDMKFTRMPLRDAPIKWSYCVGSSHSEFFRRNSTAIEKKFGFDFNQTTDKKIHAFAEEMLKWLPEEERNDVKMITISGFIEPDGTIGPFLTAAAGRSIEFLFLSDHMHNMSFPRSIPKNNMTIPIFNSVGVSDCSYVIHPEMKKQLRVNCHECKQRITLESTTYDNEQILCKDCLQEKFEVNLIPELASIVCGYLIPNELCFPRDTPFPPKE